MAELYDALMRDTMELKRTQRQALVMPFPLGKFMAQVVVPRDVTAEECARLCAMLQTLVIPAAQQRAGE